MRRLLLIFILIASSVAQINTTDIHLHDSARNKDLPVKVVYPTGNEKLPFIVFSHGAGGSPTGHIKLATFWAEHGYIVAMPQHDDSIALRRSNRSGNANMLAVLAETKDDPTGWRNRVADAALVIASTSEIERLIPALKLRIDSSRIGLGGHSYGAYTSQVAAGALLTFPSEPKQTSLRINAPKAFLMMSPQGTGQMGKNIDRPMMVMTGTYDSLTLTGNNGPDWRKMPYSNAPPGEKYFAFFSNANHMSFTDRPSAGKGMLGGLAGSAGGTPDGATIQQNVFDLSLLWWDAYLKSDPKAKSSLRSGEMENRSHGNVKIEYK